MRVKLKNAILGVLIAGLLAVALADHPEALQGLVNGRGQSHQGTSAKKSRHHQSRPNWAHRKHLRSPTKKGGSPNQAVFSAAALAVGVAHAVGLWERAHRHC
jgi:hypothetical protein